MKKVTVKYLGSCSSYCLRAYTELYTVEVPSSAVMSLVDAVNIGKDLVGRHGFDSAIVLDASNGEVVAKVFPEEEEEEDDSNLYDRYWELGYNPYMGECDYDC